MEKFLRNVDTDVSDYTMSHPRQQTPEFNSWCSDYRWNICVKQNKFIGKIRSTGKRGKFCSLITINGYISMYRGTNRSISSVIAFIF